VHASLQIQSKFTAEIPPFKIDNQCFNSLKKWKNKWSRLNNISLKIDQSNILEKDEETIFNVTGRSKINVDDTFLISLKPNQKIKFTSGDLLSITPKGENRERLYSIAKIDDKLLLSVKKNAFSLCSNYLQTLHKKDSTPGKTQQNKKFHFPQKS
jgi:sulfite reductase (NADPH) flavoprotein alpha-component